MAALTSDDIRRIRLQAGLTQEQLARWLGGSVDTVRGWEQGKRRPSTAATKLLLMLAEERRANGS